MSTTFPLSDGLTGQFAVVRLWPDIKNAEVEVIARLKASADSLGLKCIEIHEDGLVVGSNDIYISKKEIDFVISLHYEHPKLYDVFSFVALWNPVQFYHQWGYQRTSRNLVSHDDFLSCSSPAADDQVRRKIWNSSAHLPAKFKLYHSLGDVVHKPGLGQNKLFYAGINWEALGKGGGRHQQLLKILDATGELRIYGPEIFLGVKVWDGYVGYVREIPFDGISMIDEISKVGIALALSSEAHKESELMSSRLFESIAAGALVVCDENPFAKRMFGDCLLFIDCRKPPEEVAASILSHLEWARANPERAIAMISRSQDLLSEKFCLNVNLRDIYHGLPARKIDLENRLFGKTKERLHVTVFYLLPEYSIRGVRTHLRSMEVQDYQNLRQVLVVDREDYSGHSDSISSLVKEAACEVEVMAVAFFVGETIRGIARRRKPLGFVLSEIVETMSQTVAVMFVAPNEELYSSHVKMLAGSLTRNTDNDCVASSVILRRRGKIGFEVHDNINFCTLDSEKPNGLGRFLFRITEMRSLHFSALRYLDKQVVPILARGASVVQELPSTIVIDVDKEPRIDPEEIEKENFVVKDVYPEALIRTSNVSNSGSPSMVTLPGFSVVEDLMSLQQLANGLVAFLGSGISVTPGRWYPVARDTIGSVLTYKGWSNLEDWGRWGIGFSHSFMLPPVQGGEGDLVFVARARALVVSEEPLQVVTITIKNEPIGKWTYAWNGDNSEKQVTIPTRLLNPTGLTEIVFNVGAPRSPADLGLGKDSRILGLGMLGFCVHRQEAQSLVSMAPRLVRIWRRLARLRKALWRLSKTL